MAEMKMNEIRSAVKEQIKSNIDYETLDVINHAPWTIVTFYTIMPNGEEELLTGVSKVCHPDRYNPRFGVEVAVDRAIAWAVREWIAPAVEVHDE